MGEGKVQRPVLSRLFVGGQRRVNGCSSARVLVFAILVCLFAMACGIVNTLTPTPQTTFAAPEPTQNVVCLALRGAVAVRNGEGRVIGWFSKNTPVCVLPERIGNRLQLANGDGTILAACIYGPERDCK